MGDSRLEAAKREAEELQAAARGDAAAKAAEEKRRLTRAQAEGARVLADLQPALRDFVAEARRAGLRRRKVKFITEYRKNSIFHSGEGGTHHSVHGSAKVWILSLPTLYAGDGESGSSPGWYVRADGKLLRAQGTIVKGVPKSGAINIYTLTEEVKMLSEFESGLIINLMGRQLAGQDNRW